MCYRDTRLYSIGEWIGAKFHWSDNERWKVREASVSGRITFHPVKTALRIGSKVSPSTVEILRI